MSKPIPPTAITIGNFDGVHLGHLQLVCACREAVGPLGRVVALCFDPHPLAVLRPNAVPARLSTFEQRREWLRQAGVDEVVLLTPTLALLAQSPDEFLQGLVERFSPRFIVEGSDFHFAKGRSGNVETLRQREAAFGYRTIVVEPVEAALGNQAMVRVSSSMVRWLLARGRVRDAHALLGRPYELVANVEKGDQRGRTIGVPTINLAPTECLLPADGIYAGIATRPDSSTFPAAISIGTKPTFGEHPRVCEAHLIGYNGPLDDYGWTVRLAFHEWLRDQLVYASIEPLIEQLQRDIERTKEMLTINLQPAQVACKHSLAANI